MNKAVRSGEASGIARWMMAGGLALAATGGVGLAQEALRASLAGADAAAARRASITNQLHNLKAGPVNLLLRAGLSAEFNSDVAYSQADQKGDVILRPMVWGDAFWRVTEVNSLNMSVGLGYAAYLANPGLNYVLVQPGSEVAFDVFTGDFRFTVYNRFDYTLDPSLDGAVSETTRFGGLNNVAGVDGVWDLKDVILRLGVGYELLISNTDDWAYRDRGTYLVNARSDFILNDMFTVGPEATVGFTSYRQDVLSDNISMSAGGFVAARLSQYAQAGLHAGYVHYDFRPIGVPIEDPDVSTWYARVRWRHRVNPWLGYTLSAGREVRLGFYSEYEERWVAGWSADWAVLRDTGLRTWFSYEEGKQPELAYDRGDELVLYLGQEYRRWGVGIEARREVLRRMEATLSYRYYDRLRVAGRGGDYASHAVVLGGMYNF